MLRPKTILEIKGCYTLVPAFNKTGFLEIVVSRIFMFEWSLELLVALIRGLYDLGVDLQAFNCSRCGHSLLSPLQPALELLAFRRLDTPWKFR